MNQGKEQNVENAVAIWDRPYTRLEELQGTYSDMYKDVNGFRPRNVRPDVWASEEALEALITDLQASLEFQLRWEREEEERQKAEAQRLVELTKDLTTVRPLRVGLFEVAAAR
jgi:HPt (histidine-containing phosphotransfer) domain-containing protein